MKLLWILALGLGLASQGFAESLFKYNGKTYGTSDLPPSTKQQLHEIELRRYKQMQALIDDAVLKMYFESKAKKTGKSAAEVEVAEFQTKKASDKEVKAFYEKNKAKIPPNYTYEQVKPEIERILMQEGRGKKRQKLLTRLKSQNKFSTTLKEPKAPKVAINTKGFHRKGKAGAKVQVVEFADYQCPHCGEAAQIFKKLMKSYGSKVELVYVDFPINRSGISRVVAEGAFCAGKQNKYWEFHNMAFEGQKSLTRESPAKFAKSLKLNTTSFDKCMKSAEAKAYVSRAKDEGDRVGVAGTPTIFINGKKYTSGHTYEDMKKAIDVLL